MKRLYLIETKNGNKSNYLAENQIKNYISKLANNDELDNITEWIIENRSTENKVECLGKLNKKQILKLLK